jgi:hypothetical protein
MDEKLTLSINDLSVHNPPYNLTHEHSLALLQYNDYPLLEPLVRILKGFPQYIDDHSTFVPLRSNSLHKLPHFFHNALETGSLSSDITESEMSILEIVTLNC